MTTVAIGQYIVYDYAVLLLSVYTDMTTVAIGQYIVYDYAVFLLSVYTDMTTVAIGQYIVYDYAVFLLSEYTDMTTVAIGQYIVYDYVVFLLSVYTDMTTVAIGQYIVYDYAVFLLSVYTDMTTVAIGQYIVYDYAIFLSVYTDMTTVAIGQYIVYDYAVFLLSAYTDMTTVAIGHYIVYDYAVFFLSVYTDRAILKAMSQGTITSADFGQRGTQLKLTLLIDNAQKVVFKPAWYPRDYVVTGTPYSGRDRHNGEIAAFYLGSLLGLRRIPLVIGRRIHFEKEILPVSTSRLITTFFEKDGESCFYGRCRYCMGPEDGVCTTNGIIEGTLVLWMPSQFKLTLHKHPWSRTYREGVQAKWETDDHYCDKVKSSPYYSTGHRLLDIIDTCIFDYLIGNADRHHYETFEGYEDSMLIMLDNGKSFGNPDIDEFSILAPLYQCCQIRVTLWEKLLAMKDGILSQVLAGILSVDPITPILTQKHLDALDRRLKTVLEQIHACIAEVGTHALVFESSIR
ncbi:glycosaminoglycan xylosylkinase [Biomphalaria glabrata]|nr:glycosaminoglycan xylosylkinase [Biomphalaria glabrata]